MNKLLVVAKNKETYFLKRLSQEVGYTVDVIDPWDVQAFPAADFYLVRTTGVYGNDRDLSLLKSVSGQVINPVTVLERFRSKLSQYEFFSKMGIPHLPWSTLTCSQKFIDHYPNVLVKPDRGQGGWGIEVLNSESFLLWHQEKVARNDLCWILQPYIGQAQEFRIFFVGDNLITLKRTARAGNFKANFSQNGEAKLAPLPARCVPFIRHLISESGALYGAIDLLHTDEKDFVLELNSVPGIEQLERISGQNVMGLILRKIL